MKKVDHELFPSAYHETTEMLIEKIERGEFTPEPPLIFDSRGGLIDGNHRFAAIFHSGKTVQIAIKFSTEEEFLREHPEGRSDGAGSRRKKAQRA